jgi:hypothetical protein
MKFNGSMLLHANLWGLYVGILSIPVELTATKDSIERKVIHENSSNMKTVKKIFADSRETAELIENAQNCKFLKFKYTNI